MTSYYTLQPTNSKNQMFVDPASIILPSSLITPESSSIFTTSNIINGTYTLQVGTVTLTPIPTFSPIVPPLTPLTEALSYSAVLNLSSATKISYFDVSGEYQNYAVPVNPVSSSSVGITLTSQVNGYYIYSNFNSESTSNMKLSGSGNPTITLNLSGYYEFFSIFNTSEGIHTDYISSNVTLTSAVLKVSDKTKTIKIFPLQYRGLMSGTINYNTTVSAIHHSTVNFITGNLTMNFYIPEQTFFTISSPNVTNATINSAITSAKASAAKITAESQLFSTQNIASLISARGDTVSADIITLLTNINNLPS